MFFIFIQRNIFLQIINNPVGTYPDITAFFQIGKCFLIFALPAANNRSQHLNSCFLRIFHDPVNDLVNRLLLDFDPADRTVRHADPGIQKTEIIIDFRNCSDCRPGIFRSCFLIDGNSGRKPLDIIDIWFFHLSKKHARIRR